MGGRVLIVDDERSMAETLALDLTRRGYDAQWCTSADAALAMLASDSIEALVTDVNMRGMGGIELCERVAQNRPDVPVLVITAFGSMDTAIAAIRAGAYDFVPKPFRIEALTIAIDRALKHRSLNQEVKRLREAVAASKPFEWLVGESPAMHELFEVLGRVAPTDAGVLVTGESGTGKELVARAIHRRSRRADGPFVAVNCAAIPEALFESEMFGHAKGAFTDARGTRKGLFAQANGGTLFLDEIAELSASSQAKLLRVLQEHAVRPVGENVEIPVDVRVISATNRDLESLVEEGRFREDLYFRVAVVPVPVPPLRARGNDVLLLAQRFLEQFARGSGKAVKGFSAPAAAKLLAYSWPGNVRELQNAIERAVALARFEEITVDDLPERVRDYRSTQVMLVSDDPSELVPMDELERRYVLKVLDFVGGNRTLAAKTLGFDRKTLYRKLKSYGMETDARV